MILGFASRMKDNKEKRENFHGMVIERTVGGGLSPDCGEADLEDRGINPLLQFRNMLSIKHPCGRLFKIPE